VPSGQGACQHHVEENFPGAGGGPVFTSTCVVNGDAPENFEHAAPCVMRVMEPACFEADGLDLSRGHVPGTGRVR